MDLVTVGERQMKKVCHMTCVHGNRDIRIFIKECTSVAQAGYDVYHVAFGESREENGVHVVGLGDKPRNRAKRLMTAARRVYQRAKALDCDIYHFHDPEMLPYGLKLKRAGKSVIFDTHEDVPAQIKDKGWIPGFLRKTVSACYRAYETYAVKRLDAVIAATPYIGKKFEGRAKRVAVVSNYPRLDDLRFHDTAFEEREAIACYAGGISTMRGEQIMRKAMEQVEGRLILAGQHPKIDAEKCGKSEVTYLGQVDREAINNLYASAVVGLVLLLPAHNYVNSQPIKMYEYMAAGIPFVASDFPLWRAVADKWNCGICTEPGNAEEAADAIQLLFGDRQKAKQMGLNGRRAVEEEYNWSVEEKKLVQLYASLEA